MIKSITQEQKYRGVLDESDLYNQNLSSMGTQLGKNVMIFHDRHVDEFQEVLNVVDIRSGQVVRIEFDDVSQLKMEDSQLHIPFEGMPYEICMKYPYEGSKLRYFFIKREQYMYSIEVNNSMFITNYWVMKPIILVNNQPLKDCMTMINGILSDDIPVIHEGIPTIKDVFHEIMVETRLRGTMERWLEFLYDGTHYISTWKKQRDKPLTYYVYEYNLPDPVKGYEPHTYKKLKDYDMKNFM
jgi:hypothetical protein